MKLLLGIETSCDDTAAAVLDGSGQVLSSVVLSQDAVHAPFGGVVPELASRRHLTNLPLAVGEALGKSGATYKDVGCIAVTAGPGLLGSVLVGLSFAKSAAAALNVPLVAVNHIEAHLNSPGLERPDLLMPCLSLVVSGGHSHLFLRCGESRPVLLAATRDDAAGEAMDKITKRLGLPYPGGPVIDRLSDRGDPGAFPFALPRMSPPSMDFSFSGLKTAVLHHLREEGLVPVPSQSGEGLPQWEYDLLASFQKRVVDHLLQRVKKGVITHRPRSLAMAGGVACNRLLRTKMSALAEHFGLEWAFPPPKYCTDNAAMVAFDALPRWRMGLFSDYSVDAFSTCAWLAERQASSAVSKRHK